MQSAMKSANGLFTMHGKYALIVGGLLFVWVFLAAGCTEETTPDAEQALGAEVQATHLVDITKSAVPHDLANSSATAEELAIFAWQEFIALTWPSVDPTTTGIRGRPNTSLTWTDDGLKVFETYRHKNELFPAMGNTDASFDSKAPKYSYVGVTAPTPPITDTHWNSLDESNEIGLCIMYANTNTRVLYEAKVNRALFDYANTAELTKRVGNTYAMLTAKKNTTKASLSTYGGICSSADADKIVMLPCGDNAVAGDAGEGAIEIKVAWRELNNTEATSGKFYMNEVQYYETTGGEIVVKNATFGLIALHIIHKTTHYPAFVFATWEQVDNYNGSNTSGLRFHNTGTKLPDIPVVRKHPIPAANTTVTTDVHTQLSGTNSVWQYYKLVGVQAKPVDGPPMSTASADDKSYYYLANIVVETNQPLQEFFGGLTTDGTTELLKNTYEGGTVVDMGGCQGCHGTQGQLPGGDMSVLIAKGPLNTKFPETINATDEQTIESMAKRSGTQ